MDNLIDKIKNYITPAPSTPATRAESLKALQDKTQLLEQQADYAEAKASVLERAKKAKKRIKATSSYPHINKRYILIGLGLLVVIIFIMVKGC